MKRHLLALAALASCGAFAQSSVTVYGIVDVGVTHATGSLSHITKLTSGNVSSSRLGFKGTEDLGGGLKASFVLEGDVNPTSGTGSTSTSVAANATANNVSVSSTTGGFVFNRQAHLDLSGSFGELRLGRDYTPTFLVDAIADPFGLNGVGANAIFSRANLESGAVSHLRASNAVSYFLPGNLGGFSGQVMYAFNNTAATGAATQDDGKYIGANAGYARGPLTLLVAASKYTLSTAGDVRTTSLGGGYDFGVVNLTAELSQDKKGAAAGHNKASSALLGLTAPIGVGAVRASYVSRKVTQDATADKRFGQLSLGYIYNLSKRTTLYTSYSRVSNHGASAIGVGGAATAAGTSSSGFDVGVKHSF